MQMNNPGLSEQEVINDLLTLKNRSSLLQCRHNRNILSQSETTSD